MEKKSPSRVGAGILWLLISMQSDASISITWNHTWKGCPNPWDQSINMQSCTPGKNGKNEHVGPKKVKVDGR